MHAVRVVNMDRNQNLCLYVKSLIEERQRVLRELEGQHRQGLLPPGDYMTCRMALLRALEELQKLLQRIEEAELSSLGV